ncbi:MAG: outer membrane beta-barrel domain-containing protein [Myxococcales bacterium]|nr:outer membrane beta-barrel domain-containing protein [Myxococcales bacterium]
MSTLMKTPIATLALGTLVLASSALVVPALVAPNEAVAERKGALDDVPAVRHRLLLVKKRFEVGLASESTINADFRHTLGAGLKLEFHASDLLSFGAVGIFGTSINTGLTDKLLSSLPEDDPSPTNTDAEPTPTQREFEAHLNSMPIHGAAYVGVTPWYGKLAAFGKFFVNFDFYFQGGIAFAQLKSDCNSQICDDSTPTGGLNPEGQVILPDNNPNDDPVLNEGFKAGLYLGGGIHVFLNDWIALDLTVRDYLFRDNPSGLDFDADLAVTEDDNRFLNHLFMGIGVSFLLPSDVKRTP